VQAGRNHTLFAFAKWAHTVSPRQQVIRGRSNETTAPSQPIVRWAVSLRSSHPPSIPRIRTWKVVVAVRVRAATNFEELFTLLSDSHEKYQLRHL
jgi:hypothetical protein